MQREALQAALSDPNITNDPVPLIRLHSISAGSDTLSWHLYFWAAPTKAAEVEAISTMLAQIKQRLYDAGGPTPTAASITILERGSEA